MNIYFSPQYGKAFESHENATAKEFVFENSFGKVHYSFLEREIPINLDNKTYKDIITPYGFGGPIVVECSDEKKLLDDYYQSFHHYCVENNIVSEFVRFHPLANHRARKHFYGEVTTIGPQVIRDLSLPKFKNMSKSLKKDYTKTKNKGLEVIFDEKGEHLDDFLSIYYSTMDRNDASDYYYFDRSFFEVLQRELADHIVYTHVSYLNQIIYSGICLYDEEYTYAFLGGTAEGYYKYRPETLMIIETFEWFRKHGVSHYLMGGGHGKEDSIFDFKRKFAKDGIYPYQVGKKIHCFSVYEKLVDLHFKNEEYDPFSSFFPAYRAPSSSVQLIRKSAYGT